jgi:TonB-linked SusC/RagA family outer membrane protein
MPSIKITEMRRLLYFFLFMILCLSTYAQERVVQGRITDLQSGVPLPGVSVTLKGSNVGVTTNEEGAFSLSVPPGRRTLVISSVGYGTKEVPITTETNLTITLSTATTDLGEVVVVAYGTQRRESMTGSVSTIGAKQLENRLVTNISQVLAGTVPGVSATAGSGQPGSSASVRVRGFGSINHGASPLYVVDGFPYDGFISDINPDDIESISILKDASSTALYGARAANGAILITTKRGKTVDPKVTLTVTNGYSQRGIPEYDMVGAYDYYPVMWRALKNSLMYPNSGTGLSESAAAAQASANIGKELVYNPFSVPVANLVGTDGKLNPNANLLYDDFDWFSPMIHNGARTEANLSTSAKMGRSDYYISLNYLKDAGFIIKSDFQRASARIGLNTQLKDWLKSGLNLSGIFVNTNQAATASDQSNSFVNPFTFARGIGPIYPVRAYDSVGNPVLDANGNHFYDYGQHPGSVNRPSGGNPGRHVIYETLLNNIIQKRNSFIGRTFLEGTFLNDFTITTNLGLDLNNYRTETFRNRIVGDGVTPGGLANRESDEYRTITLNQLLNYKKNFGNHELGVLLGHENTWRDETYFSGSRRGMNLEGNLELVNFATLNGITGQTDVLRREGYFTRLMYNLDRTYFLELSYRRDGSSRFSPESRWGDFYSIGASWNAKRESFFSNISWINDLKLRAAYGTVGNDDVIDSDGNSVYYAYPAIYDLGWNNAQEPGAIALRLPTPELTWEVNKTINIGVDFGLFRNRISGSLEFFDRGSERLLFSVPQGLSGLVTTRNENIGAMTNRGAELQLNGGIFRSQNFNWDIQLNATHLRNKINSLPNGEPIVSGTKRYEEGYDLNQFWLRQWYGVDPTDGSGLFYATPGLTTGFRISAKGDTVVTNPTNALFARSGSAIPKLFGGIGSNFQYRGFGLSFQLNYQLGGYYYDNNYAGLMTPTYGGSLHADVLNAWKAPGDISNIPRLDITSSSLFNSASNRWLIDASYLSIRNINLTYDLSRNLVSKLNLGQVRFSLIGENLAMFSKRKGLNPAESFAGTNSNVYTPNRVLSAGVNITF